MRVLVTGGHGLVGHALQAGLRQQGAEVKVAVRVVDAVSSGYYEVGNIGANTNWKQALEGVSHVVHLAARVHVVCSRNRNALAEYRKVNTEGTLQLAKQAVEAGVSRFIYLSTVKVHGDITCGAPIREVDRPDPQGPYAISKWEAEHILRELGRTTGLEVVVLRPPLVYGEGVKGNLLRLLKWIDRGYPLPFKGIENKRSLIGLENLVDVIIRCLSAPSAAGETFLISDTKDVSTPQLVETIASGMGRDCRLVQVPQALVRGVLQLTGNRALWQRLWGSLQVDCSKAQQLLEWSPRCSVTNGLLQMGGWYSSRTAREVGKGVGL